VCMILFTGAPSNYNPPYEIYYTFAPIAGFVSTARRPPLNCRSCDSVLS
jgi:hypothetical protein